jgi:hypothetical protein
MYRFKQSILFLLTHVMYLCLFYFFFFFRGEFYEGGWLKEIKATPETRLLRTSMVTTKSRTNNNNFTTTESWSQHLPQRLFHTTLAIIILFIIMITLPYLSYCFQCI